MKLCVVEAYSVGLWTSRKNWTAAVLEPVEVFDSWTCSYLRADPSLLPPGDPPGSYQQDFLASFPICLCSDFLLEVLRNISRSSPHRFWVAGPSCTRWMFSSLYSWLLGRSGMRRISTPWAGSVCVSAGNQPGPLVALPPLLSPDLQSSWTSPWNSRRSRKLFSW